MDALEERYEALGEMVEIYREALIECARLSGADMSDGVPTWPALNVWAVGCVKQLRDDYDEALAEERP